MKKDVSVNPSEVCRVVIVGGGVAGLQVATSLSRSRRRKVEVTLVDKSLSHVWKPMLHTFAAGTAYPDRQKVSFFAQGKSSGFHFCPGSLIGVDRVSKRISVAPFGTSGGGDIYRPAATFDYDVLVLAVGSRANDFATPGVAEHCLTIDDPVDAEIFHSHLRREILAAGETDATLDIAIVGGGSTGVELAAELKRAIDLVAKYGRPTLRDGLNLCLIESGSRLLPAFPIGVSEGAARTLSELGIQLRVGAMVTEADCKGFNFKDGTRLEVNLKVWAAGVKAPDVLACIEGLERSHSGQLCVKPSLQTTQDESIFAFGDCAYLLDPVTRKAVPATAQSAHQQASHFCRHFASWRRGRPILPFHFRELGTIISLADYNGWGTLGRYTYGGGWLHGLSARIGYAMLYRQHQYQLFGLTRGILRWIADKLDGLVQPPVRLD